MVMLFVVMLSVILKMFEDSCVLFVFVLLMIVVFVVMFVCLLMFVCVVVVGCVIVIVVWLWLCCMLG